MHIVDLSLRNFRFINKTKLNNLSYDAQKKEKQSFLKKYFLKRILYKLF